MKRNKLRKAYRVKRKKSIIKSRFFRLAILALFLLGEISYLLFFSPFFTIKNIQISGNEAILSENIESKILGEMLVEYGDNIFLFGPKKIENALLGIFPGIASVELKRKLPDNLEIRIKERKIFAIFKQGENDFLMDKTGVIFARLPASSLAGEVGQEKIQESTAEFPIIKNETLDFDAKLGEIALGENFLVSVLKVEAAFKNNPKVAIEEYSIVSEQRLNAKTKEGWEVYFNLKNDLEWQITELETILTEKIPPQKRKNLEYIDLRFDKVFIYPEIK